MFREKTISVHDLDLKFSNSTPNKSLGNNWGCSETKSFQYIPLILNKTCSTIPQN
jgi:hypothetical protein